MAMIMAVHIAMPFYGAVPLIRQISAALRLSRKISRRSRCWGHVGPKSFTMTSQMKHRSTCVIFQCDSVIPSPAQCTHDTLDTFFDVQYIRNIRTFFLMTQSFHTWTSQHVVTTHDAALYSVHLSSNQRNITSHEHLRNMARGRGRGITTFLKSNLGLPITSGMEATKFERTQITL